MGNVFHSITTMNRKKLKCKTGREKNQYRFDGKKIVHVKKKSNDT